ncbi:Family T1, proteasome beta subunit, threonine peptidase [Trichomonas vaginalis G3]|uniref:Family T1, proteasome beta subunit, threonine peptidase n=1 Tax=Trichomonas vaginalis (strain ATCC PRA-98 / G3) TaxID=412133 RepID=A2F3X4_TRIV3|nr:family T1, proteasome beta subunit, threonine peptidase [Trichomonas vaginalis G3]EAY00390.1 Family T1, proteasome beta subunit, threonine peptidase [Trichomonas vaginalis G3]KAI5528359.1 family T1, proteasome beta subunit, threonine peptidase [Trichomonas vaginalis G3]|eukprot:XP_001313319.1 Family T1, proteasome beta subunit, threonine peptidase [Trichomonas vaginalis G3]
MQVITASGAIVAAKYDGGILLASDLSITYGSMFRHNNVSHFVEVAPNIIIGASGEFADFQTLIEVIKSVILQQQCKHNGEYLTASEVHNYIKRYMYQCRSNMKPLSCKVIVAGINPDGSKFLACTDPYGASWESDHIGTGFGKYLQGLQIADVVNGSFDDVKKGITEVFRAVNARNTTANGKIEFITVTPQGINHLAPEQIDPNWEVVEGTWDQ